MIQGQYLLNSMHPISPLEEERMEPEKGPFNCNRKGSVSNYFYPGDIHLFSGEYHLFSGVGPPKLKLHHFEQPSNAYKNHPAPVTCTASHKREISSQCAGSAGRSSLKRICTVMASAPLFSQTCMKSRVFSLIDGAP